MARLLNLWQVLGQPWKSQVGLRVAWVLGTIVLTGLGIGSCQTAEGDPRQTTGQAPRSSRGNQGPVAVETLTVQGEPLQEATSYTGTTEPRQQVTLRAQAEGQILTLTADVGDLVQEGDPLGRLDDRILTALLNQEDAELAALEAEVAEAIAAVQDAQTQVQRAQLDWQQAQADADRLSNLAREGAISQQQAEQARTTEQTAAQVVRSSQQQVSSRQQAVTAARKRVRAQQATVAETRQRQSYSLLKSPLTGTVIDRLKEPGDLASNGDEILILGDFQEMKVVVQVSELDLSRVHMDQGATVRLDALPGEILRGVVSRIAPTADPTTRLIPVEIRLPNPQGRISGGLLARVQFGQDQADWPVIPESALGLDSEKSEGVIFVIDRSGEAPLAQQRSVILGDRYQGRVQVRSGLTPGEEVIIKSSRPLGDQQPVNISLTSRP